MRIMYPLNKAMDGIPAYPMPNAMRDRPTTVYTLESVGPEYISTATIHAIKEAYEEGSQFHRFLGYNDFGNRTTLHFAYSGTKGRDEDRSQIINRLEDRVLHLLPFGYNTYKAFYWNDKEHA